jgi:hypothetical protein
MGKMQTYYYYNDTNEVFVSGICSNIPMYLFPYLMNVKGYSERSILAILSGCSENYRLSAHDAISGILRLDQFSLWLRLVALILLPR